MTKFVAGSLNHRIWSQCFLSLHSNAIYFWCVPWQYRVAFTASICPRKSSVITDMRGAKAKPHLYQVLCIIVDTWYVLAAVCSMGRATLSWAKPDGLQLCIRESYAAVLLQIHTINITSTGNHCDLLTTSIHCWLLAQWWWCTYYPYRPTVPVYSLYTLLLLNARLASP